MAGLGCFFVCFFQNPLYTLYVHYPGVKGRQIISAPPWPSVWWLLHSPHSCLFSHHSFTSVSSCLISMALVNVETAGSPGYGCVMLEWMSPLLHCVLSSRWVRVWCNQDKLSFTVSLHNQPSFWMWDVNKAWDIMACFHLYYGLIIKAGYYSAEDRATFSSLILSLLFLILPVWGKEIAVFNAVVCCCGFFPRIKSSHKNPFTC